MDRKTHTLIVVTDGHTLLVRKYAATDAGMGDAREYARNLDAAWRADGSEMADWTISVVTADGRDIVIHQQHAQTTDLCRLDNVAADLRGMAHEAWAKGDAPRQARIERAADRIESRIIMLERGHGEASASGQQLLIQTAPKPKPAGGHTDVDGQTLMWDV